MSGLISSLLIPAVRRARRFSQQSDWPLAQPPSDNDRAKSLLPSMLDKSTSPSYENGNKGVIMSINEDTDFDRHRHYEGTGNNPAILPTSSPQSGAQRHEDRESLATERQDSDDGSKDTLVNHGISEGLNGQLNASTLGGPIASTPTQNGARDTQERAEDSSGNSSDGYDLGGQFLLPADDGMGVLRRKIHAIRDLKSSSADKAHMIHDLMTESYHAAQATANQSLPMPAITSSSQSPEQPQTPLFRWSGQSFESMTPASPTSVHRPNNPFNLTPEDLKPTYSPKPPEPESESPVDDGLDDDIEECEEARLGCQHYKRNVKLQCFTCKKWYTCRFCHDEVEDHHLNRRKTENMLCMLCGHAQPAAQFCEDCGEQAAQYYCDVCKLWDNDGEKSIYHCDDCGICRIGQGLGKDFFHCQTCCVCLPISIETTHRCIERSTQCDCPICGDYMFTSPETVVVMRCGHSIHHKCLSEYSKTSHRCPICSKTVTNMESTFRNLDRAIQSQPMPEEFKDTRALIHCNDCGAKSVVKYHWLGLRCELCESYNTVQIRLLNGELIETIEQSEDLGIPTSRPRAASHGVNALSSELESLRINTSSVPGPSLMAQLSASTGPNGPSYNMSRGRALSPVISNYFGLPTDREPEKSRSASFFASRFRADGDNDSSGEIRLWGTNFRYRYGFLDRETDPVDEASEGEGEEEDDGSESSEQEEEDDAEEDDEDAFDIFGHR